MSRGLFSDKKKTPTSLQGFSLGTRSVDKWVSLRFVIYITLQGQSCLRRLKFTTMIVK